MHLVFLTDERVYDKAIEASSNVIKALTDNFKCTIYDPPTFLFLDDNQLDKAILDIGECWFRVSKKKNPDVFSKYPEIFAKYPEECAFYIFKIGKGFEDPISFEEFRTYMTKYDDNAVWFIKEFVFGDSSEDNDWPEDERID